MKHETSEDDQVQTGKRARKSLVIAHQTSKTRGPGKRAFHHPSARQEHKAPPGFGQLDDFQTDAVFLRGLRRNLASGALVHEGHFDMVASHRLNGLSQFADLSSILL